MRRDDSGSAFPSEQHECQDNTWNQTFDSGISIFDLFTLVALHALISRGETNRDETVAQARQWAFTVIEFKRK